MKDAGLGNSHSHSRRTAAQLMPFLSDAFGSGVTGSIATGRAEAKGNNPRAARAMRGRRADQAGRAAENAVAHQYASRGCRLRASRWRVAEGELDLVVEDRGMLVFVEVKSGRFAAEAISDRQWARLEAAALRYMVSHQADTMLMRFDVGLVGPDGTVHIIENARMN
jgi:putative endonuclease